jgi:hypothetical protein
MNDYASEETGKKATETGRKPEQIHNRQITRILIKRKMHFLDSTDEAQVDEDGEGK